MTEYQLHTQGARHRWDPAYNGHDRMRNRPLSNGIDTIMTITRYGLGREHTNRVGSPAIVKQPDGEYVSHDDHVAMASEFQVEKAGLESIIGAQAETIAAAHKDVAIFKSHNEMMSLRAKRAEEGMAAFQAEVLAREARALITPTAEPVKVPSNADIAKCLAEAGYAHWLHPIKTTLGGSEIYGIARALLARYGKGAQPAASTEPSPSEDAIYLGCARMGLAEASDDEVLNFVRIAKQRPADLTPPADGQAQEGQRE